MEVEIKDNFTQIRQYDPPISIISRLKFIKAEITTFLIQTGENPGVTRFLIYPFYRYTRILAFVHRN